MRLRETDAYSDHYILHQHIWLLLNNNLIDLMELKRFFTHSLRLDTVYDQRALAGIAVVGERTAFQRPNRGIGKIRTVCDTYWNIKWLTFTIPVKSNFNRLTICIVVNFQRFFHLVRSTASWYFSAFDEYEFNSDCALNVIGFVWTRLQCEYLWRCWSHGQFINAN